MNIIQYLKENNYNGLNDHAAIRSDFILKGINCSYESELDNDGVTRVNRRYIFSNARRNRKIKIDNLCVEANGLILEAPTWKPLVLPPYTPKSNIDTKLTNKLLKAGMYDIYQIEDGTIINLYYYEPDQKWVIATSKGIDVNDCIFNKFTYMEILSECFYNLNINESEFYNNLDKSACYTLGFKHPDMHPFNEGISTSFNKMIYKIWFVQMTVLDHVKCEIKQITRSPWRFIPGHKRISNVNTVSSLFNRLKNAYDNFADNNIINYGYMLVAKNSDDFVDFIDYNVILLESSLMNSIRNLWYDASYVKFSKKNDYDRVQTILLNSFLDNARIEAFTILFPQYKDELDRLSKIEKQLIDKVYDTITVGPTIEDIIKDEDEDKEVIVSPKAKPIIDFNQTDDDIIYEFDHAVIDILCKKVTDNITISEIERPQNKIREVIHNNSNIDLFYKISSY